METDNTPLAVPRHGLLPQLNVFVKQDRILHCARGKDLGYACATDE
jgi:hypothetical protein